MKRKKGILLAAVVETFVLAILLLLFFTGSISLNLFIALAVLAGILSAFTSRRNASRIRRLARFRSTASWKLFLDTTTPA
jgi:hypothetical protein